MLLTLWVFPPVVNIGFTRSWGTKPRTVIAALAAVAIVTGLALYGNWWAPPLEVLLLVWMIYTFGHLGRLRGPRPLSLQSARCTPPASPRP